MHRDIIPIGFSDFGSSEFLGGDFYNPDSVYCYIGITDKNKLSLVIQERTEVEVKSYTILDPSFIVFSDIVKEYSFESVRYFCKDIFTGVVTRMWNHSVLSTEIAKLRTLMPKNVSPTERDKYICTSCENMFKKYDNLSDGELLKFLYDCLIKLCDFCPVALFDEEDTELFY